MRVVALLSTFFAICALAAVTSGHQPSAAVASWRCVEQFYGQIQGDWVGTSTVRVEDQEPSISFFRLSISRVDSRTFREEYAYFRRNAETGALDPCGNQTNVTSLEPDGTISCVSDGRGELLLDKRPRRQSWRTTGGGNVVGAGGLQADVTGTVLVEGMPLGLGRKGKIQKCRASWSLQGDELVGRSDIESRFRALVITKRFRIRTELRAERGASLWALVSRRTMDARR